MDNHTLQFGSKEISYTLTFQDRKSLGISVLPDRKVEVRAPQGSNFDEIEKIVRKRAPWILRQQRYFLSFEPRITPRKYISGETFHYLGRRYRLKVRQGDDESVKLRGAYIEVKTKRPDDSQHVRKLVRAWYAKRARAVFPELINEWTNRFAYHKVKPTGTTIRWMTNRWGSCTPNGKIILNVELVRAPKRCVEYVIVHELCHLIHHNHSRAFFDLQARELPDWQRWKDHLENMLA